MRNKWKKRSGEGYIDTCVLVLCAMLVIALAVKVLPVYVAKQQLDTFAAELVREAEITGRVGNETTSRAQVLSERLEIDPDIRWSRTGRIQLNEEVTVTLTMDVDIGFGGLGSFPIELTAQASGRAASTSPPHSSHIARVRQPRTRLPPPKRLYAIASLTLPCGNSTEGKYCGRVVSIMLQ